MPRARLPQLHSITDGSFEPVKKNPITLRDDEPLDENLKVIKIGGENTPLSLSKDELRINGGLFLGGKLISHLIECDSEYLTLRPNLYTRFESSASTGALDLYVLGGDTWMISSGADYNFLTATQGSISFGSVAGGTMLTQIQFNMDSGDYIFRSQANASEFFKIDVNANGATTLETTDAGGTVGHLTLLADGDLILDPASQKVIINATDGLYFDGGGDTYIYESSADLLKIKVGGDTLMTLSESGSSGNQISVGASSLGFLQKTATFDATDTTVDFRHSNKQKLTLTDNCTDIHFQFPATSGNHLCVLLQDGTGGRTISNWKTKDVGGNAGDGNSGLVLWAGGTAPSNTETSDKADIVSIYWDASNEIAYGTYTYNF